jgi:hypothetical protein
MDRMDFAEDNGRRPKVWPLFLPEGALHRRRLAGYHYFEHAIGYPSAD